LRVRFASNAFIVHVFMAQIIPFPALRPRPDLAAKICELPYDVMSSDEAREMARGNELSFLHVSKPEIDLPQGTDVYSPEVYKKGVENFARLIEGGYLRKDPAPHLYLYRQIMGNHVQTGWVATASCEDYISNMIKKHELTRIDKEDDRVRHIESLNSQTGPVFLTYKATPELDALMHAQTALPPEIQFTAPDGIQHVAWVISNPKVIREIQGRFDHIPALYIADGHHRSAAASRVFLARGGAGHSTFFLSVIFPHNQLRILPYNRVLKDWNKQSPAEVHQSLQRIFEISTPGAAVPTRKHQLAFYSEGKWSTLHVRPEFTQSNDPIERLDVTLLQKLVLNPIFGIDDPRTSKRINFVGGIRGTAELEKLVNSGEYVCAFSMFPTSIEDLMSIADRGGIMPPKSTWFEPKLRDAMFCHMI
jgi:uncharacterized protein (DUF1015 family)